MGFNYLSMLHFNGTLAFAIEEWLYPKDRCECKYFSIHIYVQYLFKSLGREASNVVLLGRLNHTIIPLLNPIQWQMKDQVQIFLTKWVR